MRKYYRNTKGQFSKKPIPEKPIVKKPISKSISKKQIYRNSKGQFAKKPILEKPIPKEPIVKKSIPKKSVPKKSVPKKSITSTSKSQQSQIKTSNKNIKNFTQNFTFAFNPRINTNAFQTKIKYLIRRILSNYHSFKFNTLTICNIKSSTIFSDSKMHTIEIGHNSSNQICKSILQLQQILIDFFKLIKQTSYTSNLYIEFIDLTISIYKF